MKNILVINGSAKTGGNTQRAADECLREIEGEKMIKNYNAYQLDIAPCTACGHCNQNAGCVISDNMQNIYEEINNADIIILASPLYFGNVSSELKRLIDRCQAVWANKFVLKKPFINASKKRQGYFVCTAGSKNADFNGASMTIDLFFKTISTKFVGGVYIDNTDSK